MSEQPASIPDHTAYRVWAPYADEVELHLNGTDLPMQQLPGNWWIAEPTKTPGDRYGYRIVRDGKRSEPLPDPRAHSLPDGVHGLGEVLDPHAFTFTDQHWRGVSLPGQVIYELHVGTFTPEGTFAGIIDKLDYLADLGVTVIELMPVQPFGGQRNWGYDGVSWHAVHAGYGGPLGLKQLVNAAHNKGIAVMLDVVYNHFGPDGNYTGQFGPYTGGGNTGWGEVVNLWGPHSDEVRRYILDAIHMWLTDYHIDGLRLDAVQTYADPGANHLLKQMQRLTDEITATTGCHKFLVAESDQNDPTLTNGRAGGGFGLAGQWDDDIHHALHTLVSGERHAYYADFGTAEVLATTLRQVFYHNGRYSTFRGRTHGAPVDTTATPASAFVTYTTTHDQTGNRAQGDRPSMHLTQEQLVLKAATIFCSPYTPMLFQGEEFAATTPFPFFCSHSDERLNQLTDEGRHREFRHFGWDTAEVPVPSDPATFASAKLDWDFSPAQQQVFAAYQQLLSLRRSYQLARPWLSDVTINHGPDWVSIERDNVAFVGNYSPTPHRVPVGGKLIYSFTNPTVEEASTLLDGWGFALIDTSVNTAATPAPGVALT
ncbi:malto-oligosyltrehalose trehalohydrolase [Corynebacterium choanae]|nr:malto-oligosyltrehalose trehalohydrolase [Corynebacterium choanae]